MTSIYGIGAYLPEKILTNNDIARSLDTSDNWIRQNTGIVERHVAASGENVSDMAAIAGGLAIQNAGIESREMDCIIVATSTPDKVFPASAAIVQAALKIESAAAFDIQCACSGFLYGLSLAHGLIVSKQKKNVLLIGADVMTRMVDWSDRATCILFGDGAGACVLGSGDSGGKKLLSISTYNDGNLKDILYTKFSSEHQGSVVYMNGKVVFKHAIEKMFEAVLFELGRNDYTVKDVSWIVSHQANMRIMTALAERLGVDPDKVVMTIDKHANTSAASVPLALNQSHSRFKSGDLVVLTAVGSGFSWGAALIRW